MPPLAQTLHPGPQGTGPVSLAAWRGRPGPGLRLTAALACWLAGLFASLLAGCGRSGTSAIPANSDSAPAAVPAGDLPAIRVAPLPPQPAPLSPGVGYRHGVLVNKSSPARHQLHPRLFEEAEVEVVEAIHFGPNRRE